MDDSLHAHLEELLRSEVAVAGFELFELELLRGGGRLTIRLSIDPAPAMSSAVSVEDCAAVSRAVSRVLDAEAEDRLRSNYVIEVSSPGLFRPLRTPRHFQRFVGEVVKVVAGDEEHTQQLRGRLLAADDRGIELETADGSQRMNYEKIRKASLDPDLDFGKARRERRA